MKSERYFFLACALFFSAFLQRGIYAQSTGEPAQKDTAVSTLSETPAQRLDRAWRLLSDAVTDAKHTDNRIQALAALSTLGRNSQAAKLISDAAHDESYEVRTAAILAAGRSKNPALITPVRHLLDDPEPEVVFTAATTLWRQFKDHSGEDVLGAVAAGERKANPGLMQGAGHAMSKTFHSPAAIAKLGAEESAGLLLGPFGFSVAAIEYMRKNGSDSARVEAIDLLAEEKSAASRQTMMDSLDDKDPGVRAAAVKALGDLHMRSYATAVGPLMDDSKLPVRLTAAAAYINCMGGAAAKK